MTATQLEASDRNGDVLLSIVCPIYNEEQSLELLLEKFAEVTRALDTRTEVLLVDDHSTDGSAELLRAACRENASLRYLRLARNSGSHIAIFAGLDHAQGDCAAFLAADLQDPPELIPQMIARWRQGCDVVWAVREEREGVSFATRLTASLFYWLVNRFSDVRMPPQGSDFALLDRRVVEALRRSIGTNPSLGGEIAALGFRQCEIPYTKLRRSHGRSKWTLTRKLKALADALVSFSYTPLRAMSYLGILVGLLGFGYGAFVVGVGLFGTPVPGWASLMVVVLVLGGVQMMMLGVLGEYLWRTLAEAHRRPRYIVEDSYAVDATTVPPERR